MQYQNPFHLFAINPQANLIESLTSLKDDLKVRLSADLAEDDLVSIRGQQLTKGEWLFWFKQLANAETRNLHLKIAENKALTNFLEYGHLGYFQHLEEKQVELKAELQEELDFYINHELIRPFFIAQYAQALLQAFKTHDEAQMIVLQKVHIDFTEEEIGLYFEELQEHLMHTTKEIKTLIDNHSLSYMSERELLSHLSDKTIQLLNNLPLPLAKERDYVGTSIGHLATYMTLQLGYRDAAEILIRQALKLKLNTQLRTELEQLLKIVKPRLTGMLPKWLFVGLGLTALLFAIKYIETFFIG